jgi:hypothetical protein
VQVETGPTPWVVERFGQHADAVMVGVVQALAAAQRAGLAAQDASGLRARYPYGSTWPARYEFLVNALRDIPGAEVIRPHGAGYRLVMINGCLLVPFLHSKTLTDLPISQARVPSALLRELTAAAVPPPREPLALFPPDAAGERYTAAGDRAGSVIAPDTVVVYIAFVANADSAGLLAAWWGIPRAQDQHGRLTWNPDPLPLHMADRAGLTPVIPAPRQPVDQDELPGLVIGTRRRPADAPHPRWRSA